MTPAQQDSPADGPAPSARRHDLVVVGAGTGNALVDDRFAHLDVAVVAEGPFGGTCLNTGCIPSKMLAVTADVADAVRDAGRHDADATLHRLRWPDVQRRVFGRLDAVSGKEEDRRRSSPFVTVHRGTARFTGARRLCVETAEGPLDVTGRRVVLAAGGRPTVPPAVADSGLPYETSDTVMRTPVPPAHLAVLGGGYIAAELAHVFHAAGSRITIIEQREQLLTDQDEDVSAAFTRAVESRYDLRLGRELTRVEGAPGALRLVLDDGAVVAADTLLVAVGRRPNTDRLAVEKGGIACTDEGLVRVDGQMRTSAEGVWALGDIVTGVPLKHVANREADVVAHNLLHPGTPRTMSYDAVPSGVFTRPQIAKVGLTEQDARAQGIDHQVAVHRYEDVAYGWALENTEGFCKILAERSTGRLLGAHLIGPQAAALLQPLVLAMAIGMTAHEAARRQLWIHPALTEVVENTLLGLRTE
ncbi:mycothione reductase [Kitasatospora sp. DSM 101779]|uniref:mycothione reductase n=1 Tax=Kitasatospora sp. DSM 101779 TaxID=2853165 RepID=UPI0021D95A2E|nr:mycothione reductase [Kitasatospora sp. DSM 101779]MCU7826840.1 mycothione reductase [Kitasatospora sp. DSM 101779]